MDYTFNSNSNSDISASNTIHGMFFNQNNTLLSIATENGYKIYEAYNFIQVSEDDEIHSLIGPLKIALTFFESQLVFFVGHDNNTTFPPTQLVVWDDTRRKKVGVIMFNKDDKISDVKITKETIFVMIPNKIILFSIRDLKYIYTIHDVDHSRHKIYINDLTNPFLLLHTSYTRPYQLKITKCNLIIFICSLY